MKRERREKKETRSLDVRKGEGEKKKRRKEQRTSVDEENEKEKMEIPVGRGLRMVSKEVMDELPTKRNTGEDVIPPPPQRNSSKRKSEKKAQKGKEVKMTPTPPRKGLTEKPKEGLSRQKSSNRVSSLEKGSKKDEKRPFPPNLKIPLPHISFSLNPFTPKS